MADLELPPDFSAFLRLLNAHQVSFLLYFVGGKVHTSWALPTSEGIIIIDTIYPYNSEELIIGGPERLGLDPADIKYVIISHAHGDHIGGAQMLQERYGAQVVMGAADWDLVETYTNRYTSMAPTRCIVATDGMELTLVDTTITLWETPGHPPGTLSYTFTVYDQGRPVQGGVFGWHGVQLREQYTGPGHPEFPDLYRVAAAHRRGSCCHRSHRDPVQPLGVRQCGHAESDARRARRRSPPVCAR
jgi:hypothetical protein